MVIINIIVFVLGYLCGLEYNVRRNKRIILPEKEIRVNYAGKYDKLFADKDKNTKGGKRK